MPPEASLLLIPAVAIIILYSIASARQSRLAREAKDARDRALLGRLILED